MPNSEGANSFVGVEGDANVIHLSGWCGEPHSILISIVNRIKASYDKCPARLLLMAASPKKSGLSRISRRLIPTEDWHERDGEKAK